MRTVNKNNTAADTTCTPAQKAFLNFIDEYSAEALVKSLRAIHDMALYNSDVLIHQREKQELFDVKLLADELEKVV